MRSTDKRFDLKGMARRARTPLPVLFSDDVRRMNVAALSELEDAEGRAAKRNKYGAKGRRVDGQYFQSGLEAERGGELKLQERAGVIKNLRPQVTYDLHVHGVPITTYRADFVYEKDGREIVEDTKGFATEEYKIKRALMLAVHGIEIREVRK